MTSRFKSTRKLRSVRSVVALVIASAACNQSADGPASVPTVDAIPLEVLFANPAVRQPRLSPGGERVAWIADRGGEANIWTRRLDEQAATPLTQEIGGIDEFLWTADGSEILFLRDDQGDRQYSLYAIDPVDQQRREIATFDDTYVDVLGVAAARPDEVLLTMNLEDKTRFDVYRLSLSTGELVIDVLNPGFLGSPSGPQNTWHIDDQLQVRAAIGARSDGGADLYALTDNGWTRMGSWSLEDGEPTVVAIREAGIWLLDPRGSNTSRLVLVDWDGNVGPDLAGDDVFDVDNVLMSPTDAGPLAASIYAERRVWTALDPSVGPDLAALNDACKGDLSFVSRSDASGLWLAACEPSDSPGSYLLLQRETGAVETLFERSPPLSRYTLAPKEPFSIAARDGLALHGYVTRPPGSTAPAPAVVLVHGGPWARDTNRFDPVVQWLANRGYGVLQVNFRGSTGYGHAFAAAGKRQFGAAMQDDLADAVDWAVAEGLVDPDRIAIMGGSYGGYAALAGLAFSPGTYRAGISIVGFGNLLTLLERVAPMFQSSVDLYYNYIGDPRTDMEEMRRRSPYFHVDRIVAPVLLGHGVHDPLVPVEESQEMAQRLEERGVPTTLVLWPDEGHGLSNPVNRLSFFGLAESFLECHVKGRADACPPAGGSAVENAPEEAASQPTTPESTP